MEKKEYIGEMHLEDFKKLSYEKQGKYLDSLEGIIVEDEDKIDINDMCVPITCSKEEYVKQHGYISLEESRRLLHEMIDKEYEDVRQTD